MPKGDDKEVVQITRVEWNEFCDKLDRMSVTIDKIYRKLFGDPDIGEDGMYEEHKLLWKEHCDNDFWRSKKISVLSTISGVVGLIGAIIAVILSSRQL